MLDSRFDRYVRLDYVMIDSRMLYMHTRTQPFGIPCDQLSLDLSINWSNPKVLRISLFDLDTYLDTYLDTDLDT